MASSAGSVGGGTIASNPRVWIVAGIAVVGVIVMAEAARRRRRWLRLKSTAPPDSGAFCDRFVLTPPPQPPPPAARHLLAGLTFAASDNFEMEGYIAGFGNPDWKSTHEAAKRTAVAVTTLRNQGATCVGRTVMDELGFGVTGENLHCGTPINSASPSLVPGGSCCGSAVAVSAKLVDFSLGTDTIGDVRIPASFCGLLCFRPSYGVVSTLGTIANSQSLDTIGWFARDPCVLHRVGDVLLPAASGGAKQTRQIVFADDCFEFLKISNQKTVHAIKSAVQTLPGYQPPKHINIGQYIYSNVPSLKEFCEPATKLQGVSALKALSTVMQLLQRYEFKANHEDWVNTVKPKLGLDISTRVLRAVNFTHDNIKSLYAVRNELRAALKNLLKDTGVLVVPTTAGYPLKRNSKERLSSGFEDRMYAFVGISALSGCCEVTIPLANHSDHHISLSFVAAHGSDKFLLHTILDTYSLIQEQVVSASKLVTTSMANGDADVDASELLKEKGNSAFKRKEWSKAIEFYSQAINLHDTNATYYCNRAAAYLELGRFKQAEADCDRALLLDRKNVKAYLRRGTAKEVTLNYREALQDFRNALALEPQNKAALAAERRLQKLLK